MRHPELVSVITFALFGVTEGASAEHGRTAGAFSVSNSGAAQYSIPIWTPPGVNGLQPNLALNYSSTKSDGLLGAGFSVPGFSSIGHCNATIAQDGYAGGLGFGTFSILCLDGNRLRLQSGLAGQATRFIEPKSNPIRESLPMARLVALQPIS